MADLLIQGAQLLDPELGNLGEADIRIANGRIQEIGKLKPQGEELLDARGLTAIPGLVDLHVHVREPGAPEKEDFQSLAHALIQGGVTTALLMPNTQPPVDTREAVRYVLLRAREIGGPQLLPSACLTRGRAGREALPYRLLMDVGARAFTDDGSNPQDAGLMRSILQALAPLKALVLLHPEDASLSGEGLFHEGRFASWYGFPGIPASAEAVQVARDGLLAHETGCPVHFTHISSSLSCRVLSMLQHLGAPVSADTTLHHLWFSEQDLAFPGALWKMKPPLRAPRDRDALRDALLAGVITCIATDHAPHGSIPPETPVEERPFGVSVADLVFPVLHSLPLGVPLERKLPWMTTHPARLLGLRDRGRLQAGWRADIVLVDTEKRWTPREADLLSKGKNCPWLDTPLQGFVVHTIVGGKVVRRDGSNCF